MIKIRHRRDKYDPKTGRNETVWCDAFLVQMLHDPLSSARATAVIAYHDNRPGVAWSEEGMEIMVETSLSNIRIARSRIPLFSTAEANGAQSPDAPKV